MPRAEMKKVLTASNRAQIMVNAVTKRGPRQQQNEKRESPLPPNAPHPEPWFSQVCDASSKKSTLTVHDVKRKLNLDKPLSCAIDRTTNTEAVPLSADVIPNSSPPGQSSSTTQSGDSKTATKSPTKRTRSGALKSANVVIPTFSPPGLSSPSIESGDVKTPTKSPTKKTQLGASSKSPGQSWEISASPSKPSDCATVIDRSFNRQAQAVPLSADVIATSSGLSSSTAQSGDAKTPTKSPTKRTRLGAPKSPGQSWEISAFLPKPFAVTTAINETSIRKAQTVPVTAFANGVIPTSSAGLTPPTTQPGAESTPGISPSKRIRLGVPQPPHPSRELSEYPLEPLGGASLTGGTSKGQPQAAQATADVIPISSPIRLSYSTTQSVDSQTAKRSTNKKTPPKLPKASAAPRVISKPHIVSPENLQPRDDLAIALDAGLVAIVQSDAVSLDSQLCNSSGADLIEAVIAHEEEELRTRNRASSPNFFQDMLNEMPDSQDENFDGEAELPRELGNTVTEDGEVEPDGMQTPIIPHRRRICFPKPSKRKRIRDPSKWTVNIQKEAKNAGQGYTSKRGKVVDAVRMKHPCCCRKRCFRRLTDEDRQKVFTSYYSTKSQHEKWDFITRHSESANVSRRTTTNETSRRNSSRNYFFFIGPEEEKVYVCKTMFVNTLSISHGVIDTAYKHLFGGKTKLLSPDKRGKHSNRPKKTSEEKKESIRRHINLYPRIPSHYTRARSQREYLEWGMSMSRMSKQYVEWCASNNISKDAIASRREYHTLLCTEFNISFFKPKKDQCALCRLIKTGTRAEREHYKEKYAKHQMNKKLARNQLKIAKEMGMKDKTVKVCAFDLQKVLPLPKSEVSTFFYMNKLSLYNLSSFDLVLCEGICHLWHEGVAKRGSNEISSCMFQYVAEAASKNYKTILSFSDSCGGQNKNRFFFAMMVLASAKYNITFQHTFLEPGHTQNENDSVHARIESEAKLQEIFSMDEWIALIEAAKQEEPMYEVKVMKRTDIFDFHELVDSLQQWERDTTRAKIAWSKVKILRTDPSQPGILYFKYSYDGQEKVLNTKKTCRGRPVNLKTHQLKLAYPGKLPLAQLKIEHLTKLCKTLSIPSKYHNFYKNVISNAEPEIADEDTGENEEDSSDDELYEAESRRDDEEAEVEQGGEEEDEEAGGEED